MGHAEDELERYMRWKMDFRGVKVEELLPYLPCLTKTDQEELRANLNNKGNQNTVWHLLLCLQRRNEWPTILINALRRFEYTDLADELQHKYSSLTGRSHQNNIQVAPAKATSTAATTAEVGLPHYSSSSLSQNTHHAQSRPSDPQNSPSKKSIFPHVALQPVIALQTPHLQSYPVENSASAAVYGHSSLLSSDTENGSHPDNEDLDNFKTPVLETQQSSEVELPNYSSSSLSQDSHHTQQLPFDTENCRHPNNEDIDYLKIPIPEAQQSSEVELPSYSSSSLSQDSHHAQQLPFDTEDCRHPNNEDIDDLKIPVLETQQSAREISRKNITSETGKVSGKDPQQNFFSPAAAAPVIKLGAEEPEQIGAVVGASINTRVTSRVSEEGRSMSISKPGVLTSHLDEEQPYSGNSGELQLSESTAETAENNCIPGDSRNAHLHDKSQLPEVSGASPMNIDSNQISDSNDWTIRHDPLMISKSTTDILPVNVTVPRAGEPEENHYCYDSSSHPLSRRNRNAILDRPDIKDSIRERRGVDTKSLMTRYMASGTVDRHNERRIQSDGINSEKCDDMGRNYGNKTTSDDIFLQPEREKTIDPVENSWNSTDTRYYELRIAEDPGTNLEMANNTIFFKDSISTSSDTPRKENVPAESSERKPMLSSTLLFSTILVAFSSVTAILLWKYLRN